VRSCRAGYLLDYVHSDGDTMRTAIELCQRFEGYRSNPYLCPAGVWTIGYGTTRYPDGTRVKGSDPAITEEYAAKLLTDDLLTIKMQLMQLHKPLIAETDRLEALTDWVYNLGIARLFASTMWRKVKVGNWQEAATQCQKWVYGGGRVLPGLVLRRRAEAVLLRG